MRWRQLWGVFITVGVLSGLALPAHAMSIVHQKSNGLYGTSLRRTRRLNDRQVHYVTVPKHYAHAKHPHGIDTIRSSKGHAVTFKTKYLLPYPGYHRQAWGNPQGMARAGRYLYVVYCPTKLKNKGRLVRLDEHKLAALHATARQLQKVYTKAAKHNKQAKAIRRAIKVGPLFTTGHGQSLAYNPKNQHLYMWCDREKAPRVPINQYGYINRISAKTLRPAHQIRVRLKQRGYAVPGGHVLTFDRSGRAYFWSCPSKHLAYIYQGRITDHRVKFRLTRQILTRGPGTRIQSMGYNPRNNRLHLVSDGSIVSLPVQKLAGRGHLTSRQVRWTRFASRREFEGLDFDQHGHAYLLSNHHPEVLVGNRTTW